MRIIEILKNLDIFSESIQFNSTKQKLRKRTIVGAFLTTSIFTLTGIYFFYLSYLYFNGQIEPKFRQQTFVSDETEVQLENDMIGFDFFSVFQGKFLNQLQAEQNKTFIVFIATFTHLNKSNSSLIPLNIIKCQNPELLGMLCFDFSSIHYKSLILKDFHKVLSTINLMVYRCQDTDLFKTFIPDNCAEEKMINNLINISPYRLNIKIKISQFNTTKQEMKSEYRSQLLQNTANILQKNDLKIQTQITNVKQGLLIQSENTYTSPLSYQLISQAFNKKQIFEDNGFNYFSCTIFNLDENVTKFNIQYPIFPEILTLCNSVLSFLLFFGIFSRKIAQNFIRRDIFLILLRNMFLGTYLKALEHNQIISIKSPDEEKYTNEDQELNQIESDDEHNSMPSYQLTKSCKSVFNKDMVFNVQDIQDDYIKENFEIKQSKDMDDVSKYQSPESSILKKEQQFNHQSLDISNKKLNSSVLNKSNISQVQIQAKKQIVELKNNLSVIPKRRNRSKIREEMIKQKQNKNIKNVIQQTNNNFNTLNNNSLSDKLQKILFPTRFCKKKKFLQSKGFKKEVLNKLEQQVDDSLDFFTFHKELLFLKKAIMILLSKEQLAAIQVLGIEVDSLQLNQENQFTTTKSDEDASNHLSEQFKIMQSKQLQLHYINQFLLRCKNGHNLDSLDQRIFSSLLSNYQN